MTLADEMAEFEKYDKLLRVEFYEFLARWAHYTYKASSMQMVQKI
jgi:hypothetical protein